MSRTGLKIIDRLLKRNSIQTYQELMESQYYPFEQLQDMQNVKLQKLVNHAYRTTKFYRNSMDRLNLAPSDIKNQEDLQKLPVITKATIRKDPASFLSSEKNAFHPKVVKTGGSTGIPFEYCLSRNFDGYLWGGIWRAWSVGGYTPGDKVAAMGGDSLTKKSLKHRFYHLLNNWKNINVTDLSEPALRRIFNRLKSANCKMIYAYPTPLYLLANHMTNHQLEIRVNHIVTTSEMLFPEHRKTIQKAFQCRVFDLYGANDGGVLSFECDRFNGYHLAMEKCITEILNDRGEKLSAGTVGNVVLTDLENYAMPFIRYQVGDLACITNEPCQCGRGLNRLKKIHGRIKDFVELKEGVKIDGSYFTKRFRNVSGLLLFQIIQTHSNDVYAKVSCADKNDPAFLQAIKKMKADISKELGIDFDIRITGSFTKTPNQKFQYILKE